MFLGLQGREAGASHRTWIIKTKRTPLLFCRVSAQSVGKVETGDTVLKGAGNENTLVLQMKEVWCWDWVTNGRGSVGRGLKMIWNGFREGGRIFGGITRKDWYLGLTEKSVVEKSVGFCCSITRSVFVLSWRRYAVCQTLSDYTLRGISPFECINVYMPLYMNKTVKIVGKGISVGEHLHAY